MSNSTESPISISVRTPKGTIATLRADNGQELDQILAMSLESIKSAVAELEAGLDATPTVPIRQAVSNIAKAFPNASVISDTPTPPPATAGIGGGRNCQHGKMTALQGPSKQGGVYKGYFCPSAQGDPTKCKTIYIDKTSPEWNTFVPDRIK